VGQELQLGYLVLGAENMKHLDRIFTEVLGLQRVDIGVAAMAYRMDDWDRRFVVMAGANGLSGVGLVARDWAAYVAMRAHLVEHGVPVTEGTPEECAMRAVREFVAFSDPAGNRIELATEPAKAVGAAFASPLVPGGFLTGSRGLGHVVLLVDDREANSEFYQNMLGFEVSDTSEELTPDGSSTATFLHCNRRHHTVALVQRLPRTTRTRSLGHFMIQANEFDAVGMAYDRAVDAGLPIFRGLGRHPNDRMFSFYARTDAGFDIEFGSGAVEVDGDWQVMHYQQISSWGHRPGPGMIPIGNR
jgi:biphenyl-2,3-diol 1,2-dioxygenase